MCAGEDVPMVSPHQVVHPSLPGDSLGDLLRDAPVLEPDLGFLHRLHGEALDVCGSEGASSTKGLGLQGRGDGGCAGGAAGPVWG